MDSNSDKLAHQNMIEDASLTSLESGFVSLTGLGTKEEMDVEIGLISNKIEEKKKDAKISAKPGELSNSFKELGGETNDNIKRSCQSTTNCLSSINNSNKNHSPSLFKKIFVATILIFGFILIMGNFYFALTDYISRSIYSKKSLNSTILFGSLLTFFYFVVIYFYFVFVHKIFLVVHPSLKSSKCFSTLFKIVSGIFVFIIAFFSLLIILFNFYANITIFTIKNYFSVEARICGAFILSLGLFCQLYLYFSSLKTIMNKFPFTMDFLDKFFF